MGTTITRPNDSILLLHRSCQPPSMVAINYIFSGVRPRKEMNVLCIGPGRSAIEYQDYCQFNTYDYKIGCRELLSDPAWLPLDYIAVGGVTDYQFIHKTYPEYTDRIVTIPRINPYKTNNVPFNVVENTWSIQLMLAKSLGATHITTVGFDILAGDIRTLEDTVFRQEKPIQTHVVEQTRVREKAKIINSIITLAQRKLKHIEVEHKLTRIPV